MDGRLILVKDISAGLFVASTGLEWVFVNERDGSVVSFNVLSLRMVVDWLAKGVVRVVAVANEKDVVEWSLGPPQLITHSSIVSKLFSFPWQPPNTKSLQVSSLLSK